MKKKNNSEYFDAPLSDIVKHEIEQHLLREKIIYQVKEDLYCNSRYKNFFENYDEETIYAFAEEYAKRKSFYLLNGDKQLEQEETNQLYFYQLAEKFIWEIQQKKLFDLQCLWRAKKIQLDGVEVTKDFLYLESDIKNCPHIKPITGDELQVYVDYLLSENYSDNEHNRQWQDYDFIKSQRLMFGDSAIPSWYMFYDKYVNLKSMHDLPDIKGEKESYYLDLLCKKQSAVIDVDSDKNEIEVKPPLHFNYKTLEFFVNTFEDKAIIRYFYAAEKSHPDLDQNAELNHALQLLKDSDDIIPVHTNKSWKEAVLSAAKFYKTKRISQALVSVYDQYLMRKKTNLPFYDEFVNVKQQLLMRNVEQYKKQILLARKLNGESQDFTY
jgi:hypothetical protein